MATQSSLRYSVENSDNSVRIVIPSRKSWWRIFLLIFCLLFAFWIAIGIMDILFDNLFDAFSVGWYSGLFANLAFQGCMLIAAMVVIGIGLLPLLWQIFGKEALEFDDVSITAHRQVFGLGPCSTYQAKYITNMCVSPAKDFLSEFGPLHLHRKPPWTTSAHETFGDGSIVFHYEGFISSRRFGVGLDANEAQQVLNLILQHFPDYQLQDK